jgi:hypothetical protein
MIFRSATRSASAALNARETGNDVHCSISGADTVGRKVLVADCPSHRI